MRAPASTSQAPVRPGSHGTSFRSTLGEAGLETTPALVRLVFATLNGLVLQQLYFGDARATDESLVELRRLLAGAAA